MMLPRTAGRALLLATLLLLAAAARGAEPSVILLSLDGVRADALPSPELPAFAALEARGVRAESLEPVFPTNTFPNHVSLATGVAPERHGIVNNVFRDPERGLFRYEADPSWIEVEPLWSLATRAGVISAVYHWVGSEGAWRNGVAPRYWRRFDASVPERDKVEQILAWLDLEEGRPRLILCWLPGADRAGHRHGPHSKAVREALQRQDAALARLLRGIEARRLWPELTLVVVSDHGMERVLHSVDLRRSLRRAGLHAEVLGGGGFASLVLPPGAGPHELAALLAHAEGLGLEAYARASAPPELRLGSPRFGDAVVLAPPGTALAGRGRRGQARGGIGGWLERLGLRPRLRGTHGYRPEHPAMGAIFLAAGRGVPAGIRLGRVRALDVAPTVLGLLGIPAPSWMEGRSIAGLGARRQARQESGTPTVNAEDSR